jgi:hypothetical protein
MRFNLIFHQSNELWIAIQDIEVSLSKPDMNQDNKERVGYASYLPQKRRNENFVADRTWLGNKEDEGRIYCYIS